MKLLLDTHIWLWSLLAPNRLGKRAARALESADNELWLSPVSVWELSVLVERGRVKLKLPTRRWVDEAFRAAPINEAALNREVALMSRELVLSHQDPADRFIAATAAVHELTLVTADDALLAGRGYKTLASR